MKWPGSRRYGGVVTWARAYDPLPPDWQSGLVSACAILAKHHGLDLSAEIGGVHCLSVSAAGPLPPMLALEKAGLLVMIVKGSGELVYYTSADSHSTPLNMGDWAYIPKRVPFQLMCVSARDVEYLVAEVS